MSESKGNRRIHQYRGISAQAHLLYSGVEVLSHLRHPGDAETAPGFSGRGARACRRDCAADGSSSGLRAQRAALGSAPSCRPL